MYPSRKDVAATAACWFRGWNINQAEPYSGVKTRKGRPELQARTGQQPKPAPLGIRNFKNRFENGSCPLVALRPYGLWVSGLDGKMAFSILECEQDETGHDLICLETCNDARKVVFGGEGNIRREPEDGADVAGQEESVECQARVPGQRFENNGHGFVKVEDKKIVLPVSLCFQDNRCRGRCGGFEPHTCKDDGHARHATCEVEGPCSRKDHVHGGSECSCLGEGKGTARDPDHVAVSRNGDFLHTGKPDNRINVILGSHADRATGSGNKRNVAWKKGPKT